MKLNPALAYADAVADTQNDCHLHLPRLKAEAHGTVLELGTRKGLSTSALLCGVEEKGGQVWSVDINPECAEVFAGHPQWHFIHADSTDECAIRRAGLPLPLDVLFIDTAHTYRHTLKELMLWGPCVRAGGVILLHDTDDPLFPMAVRRAVYRFAQLFYKPRLYFFEGCYGLGMVRC